MDFAEWTKANKSPKSGSQTGKDKKDEEEKKKQQQKQQNNNNYGAVGPLYEPVTSPVFVYNPNTSSKKSSTDNSFSTWTANSRANASAGTWAKESSRLVDDMSRYYSTWNKDSDERTKQFQSQLSAYIDASKKYKSSFNDQRGFNQYVSGLNDARDYAKQSNAVYSQFSTKKDYDRAVQEANWEKKYANYTYGQKKSTIEQMKRNNPSATVDERKWLEQHLEDNMTSKDYDDYIADKQRELAAYEKTWNGRSSSVLSDPETAANEWMSGKKAIQDDIERVKSKKYFSEKGEEYEAIKNNPDFARYAKVPVTGDIRRKISTGGHLVQGEYVEDVKPEGDWKDEDWTQDEVDTATYIWNTQGEEAAKKYWDDYLKYKVLERAANRKQQEYAAYATKNFGTGALASLGSVGATLMSGTGLTSVAAQNLRNALAGEEGYRPINYYGDAYDASRFSSATRGAISSKLDEKGTIQLDEKEHPFWAKLLNGKGLGFLYQTGMSMADSAALAGLTMGLAPALGEAAKFTTVLLGGSAGSQGVLDALERGATDSQALWMGIFNGTFEALFEEVSLDHLIHPDKNFIINLLKQGFIEGSEEVSTSVMNNIADIAIMAANSDYRTKAQAYMDQGMSEDEAMRAALKDIAVDIGWDFVGGAISGGIMGGLSGARATIMRNASYVDAAKMYEAGDVVSGLQEVDPNNKLAARMQTKLTEDGDLSSWNKARMLNQTEQAIIQRDAANVRQAVVDRLTALGENVRDAGQVADAIVDIVSSQQLGEEAANKSKFRVKDSAYGQRVLNELTQASTGEYSSEWTQNINTEILGKANQDVYRFQRAISNYLNKNEESLAEEGYTVVRDENGRAVSLEANRELVEEAPADINELSSKYKGQAQAFVDNYEEGQSVEDYDAAFHDAYEMASSGLTMESVTKAMEGSILSESQLKAAYQAGREAADAVSARIANENRGKALRTNKKGWRRGSVSADGVTMSDLDTALNDIAKERGENVRDFVRKAVDMMRVISEATGVDVVLYKSAPDADGVYRDAQGRYEWKDSKIYVDINAGLKNISEAGDIGKYIMMQTFTHEFVHFMEQWSPAEFDELRSLVFQEIAKSEDVDALIRDKQRRLGDISYDQASKEVVADGLSRLLPQSNFVENLATEHQNIFQKLMARLKEFLNDLKQHFAQLGQTNQREISYLTEDVDGQIQYVQDIVDLFDFVAQNAVENYQQTLEGFPADLEEQVAVTQETSDKSVEERAETAEPSEVTQKTPPPVEEKKEKKTQKKTAKQDADTEPVLSDEYISYIMNNKSKDKFVFGDIAYQYKKAKSDKKRLMIKAAVFTLFDVQKRSRNLLQSIKNETENGGRKSAAPYTGEIRTLAKLTAKQMSAFSDKVAIGPYKADSGIYFVTDGYKMIFVTKESAEEMRKEIESDSKKEIKPIADPEAFAAKSVAPILKGSGERITKQPIILNTSAKMGEYWFDRGNNGIVSFNTRHARAIDTGALYLIDTDSSPVPLLGATDKDGNFVGFTLPIKINPQSQTTKDLLEFAPTLFEWADEYDNQKVQKSDREQAFSDLSFEQAEKYIDAGLPVAPEAEVEWSIRTNTEQMDKTEAYVSDPDNEHLISEDTLKSVRALREKVAAYLEKFAKELNLPNEVIGNPFVANGSYDISYDPTTICVRSLGVLRLQQLVSERLGRPLTARENFEITQEAFEWTDNPQCLYCFAALDRMAKSEYLMDFINRQNRAVKALNDGAKKTAAYKAFLPDGHKGSAHMKQVFDGIYDRWQNKGRLLTLKDASTYEKLNELINRDDVGGIGELAYWANQYAQNASWAKAQRQYQAYNGQILKWDEDRIKTLNSHYGLRLNSHSEFSPAFILEYLQIYTDAAARGLKALEYTSDINAAKIFAPTGAAINMSISITGDSYDNMGMDAMQGCDWNEARAVRDQYANAGIVAVSLNDEQTRWALDQDWIDVVIPMHLVKTGDEIAKFMNWTNTKAISEDKKQKGKWKGPKSGGADASHIYPSVHLNDKATYLKALEENHLTPRFQKWLDHPNYMKLVNETRQSTTEMKPLQPVFDEDAMWAAIKMMEARGGYFEKIGHTEEGEEYIADEMTERFKKGPRYFQGNPRGKVAADMFGEENVEYSKRDAEYMDAVERGDTKAQQKMVDEAANNAGYSTKVYHGGADVTVFDTSRGTNGATQYGPGTYVTNGYGLAEDWAVERDGKVTPLYLKDGVYFEGDNARERTAENDHNTPQWKKLEKILKDEYGLTDEDIRIGEMWGFESLAKRIDPDAEGFFVNGDKLNDALRRAGYAGVHGTFYDMEQWCVFDPSSLKSADQITYDDGNAIPLSQRFNPENEDIRYSSRELDDQYMQAVESGDKATQEQMVKEAAERAGYTELVYHGTNAPRIDVFTGAPNRIEENGVNRIKGYFTDQRNYASSYGDNVRSYYVNTSDYLYVDGVFTIEEMEDWLASLGITDVRFNDQITEEELESWFDSWGGEYGEDRIDPWLFFNESGGNLTEKISEAGYRGVMWEEGNFDEDGGTAVMPFYSSDIKSADPITYDDKGNVIPLSQRFNPNEQDIRLQQREEAITDRELLQMSAEEMLAADNLTEGEREAVSIMNERLTALQDLKDQRAELGKLWKQQQFEEGGDRAKAPETLSRMKILDQQIARAENSVLEVENTDVLKRVLKQARRNLEAIDRNKAIEMVQRYRDRRNNAEAVRKYRARINKDASDITNWIIKPNGKDAMKNVPAVIREPIVQILQSIDRSSKRSLRGGPPTKADLAYLEQMRKLQAVMSTRTNTDSLYTGYTDLPENFMENLDKIITSTEELAKKFDRQFVLNQMTADELKTMSEFTTVLKNYIHKASRTLSLVGNISELGDSSIEDMSAMQPLNARGPERFMMWQTMRPIAVFDRFGRGGQKIFKSLMKGQSQLAFDTKEIIDKTEEIYANKDTIKKAKRWMKELITVKLGGEDVQMPISYAMGLYELSKRKNAEGHLYGNGVRVATFKNGTKKIADQGHKVTRQEIQNLAKQLNDIDPKIIEVADKLQNYMAEKGAEWGNYVSVARFGIEQFTEPDYYPIASDGRFLPATADEKPSLASLYALLNMSFTKELNENANNRAMVYDIFDVFANHMSAMAQYHSFALPVLDSLKWLNYEQFEEVPDTYKDGRPKMNEDGTPKMKKGDVIGSVKEQMARAFGGDVENAKSGASYAQAFVTNILKAINGTSVQGDGFDTIGMKGLHAYNVSRIAYNVRVVMQQPMALTRAAMVMSPVSITKALARQDKLLANIKEMQEKNGIAAWKSLGFYDVNVSRAMTDLIKHDDTALQKINEFGLLGAEVADKVTWAVMWQAAKYEVQRKGIKESDDGYWDAVNDIFDETIYRTQVVDSVLTKNEYLRSKNFFARATGSFMNEPMTTYSMLASAYDKFRMDRAKGMSMSEAWKKNGKNIGRTAAVYAVSAILLAAVQGVADAWRDDDEYETFGEKMWEAFTGNVIDELTPFNNLPLFSDAWNFGKKMASLFGVDTYGSMPRSIWLEFGQELYDGTKRLVDKINTPDETNYTWYGAIYKLLGAASGITGAPLSSTTREAVSAWNNTVAHFAPSLKIKDYDPGKKAEIKYAYMDGYLTAEEAIAELVAAEEADENEAYWLVNGWANGESTSKYSRMYTALLENPDDFKSAIKELTDHGVKEKEAISQAKSQIGKWYRGDTETVIDRTQAKKMLTKYVGMKEDAADELITEWTMKKDTGISYSDMKEAYLDGEISYNESVRYRVKYGGEEEDEAEATLTKWKYEKDTGIAYSDMKEAYMDGELTYAEAVNDRKTYGGVSEDDATETVDNWKGEMISGYAKDDIDDAYYKGKITKTQAYNAYLAHGYEEEKAQEKADLLEFRKAHPEAKEITAAAMRDYKEYCEAYGVPADMFLKTWNYKSKTSADVDANGDAINGSKRAKVLAYIDELPISNSDKDALYYACGYAPSTLKNAPWHRR